MHLLVRVLQGPDFINRAMDGDEVVVEMLPESAWISASNKIMQEVDESETGMLNQEAIPRPNDLLTTKV
jgi:hypothetical protein